MVLWLEKHLLSCSYKQLLGFDCPGCGLQRSFIALLKGNIPESLQLYPALLPLLFTLVYTALHIILKFDRGPRIIVTSFITTVILTVLSYLFKMLC